MAAKDEEKLDELEVAERSDEARPADESDAMELTEGAEASETSDAEEAGPATLGATRYVHAAFLAGGILFAYLSGKLLGSIWGSLANWPAAVRQVPMLLQYSEQERGTITTFAGGVIGVIAVIQLYRKEHIRRWADDVATELSKVTWPNKEMVTNGTIVVLIASAVFTVYVALLDRLWGFVTNLVYNA